MHKRHVSNLVILLTIVIFSLPGCGESGPKVTIVEGKVSYNGKPVSGGMVRQVLFVPTEGTERQQPATGIINNDGTFSVQSFPGRKGVLPGNYTVVIDIHDGTFINNDLQYLIPEKYTDFKTSGLTIEVPSDQESISKNFDLRDY